MASDTGVEWADDTVNGWWGCAKVSPACAHCYAEGLDARFHPDRHIDTQVGTYVEKSGHWGATAPRKLRVDAAIRELEAIARRSDREGRPRRVFMHSMSDFFEDRADLVEPRKRMWDALHRLCPTPGQWMLPRLIPMLLTKRPEVMAAWAKEHGWPQGAWAGTTVEDQQRADERIPHLLRVPAPVRFVSCEPLLGPVDLTSVQMFGLGSSNALSDGVSDGRDTERWSRIHWVIAGGESGPKARPTHPDWFRSLRDQCQGAGVPFFFKQWGAWAPSDWLNDAPNQPFDADMRPKEFHQRFDPVRGDTMMSRVGKKAAGATLDGREWREVPNDQ